MFGVNRPVYIGFSSSSSSEEDSTQSLYGRTLETTFAIDRAFDDSKAFAQDAFAPIRDQYREQISSKDYEAIKRHISTLFADEIIKRFTQSIDVSKPNEQYALLEQFADAAWALTEKDALRIRQCVQKQVIAGLEGLFQQGKLVRPEEAHRAEDSLVLTDVLHPFASALILEEFNEVLAAVSRFEAISSISPDRQDNVKAYARNWLLKGSKESLIRGPLTKELIDQVLGRLDPSEQLAVLPKVPLSVYEIEDFSGPYGRAVLYLQEKQQMFADDVPDTDWEDLSDTNALDADWEDLSPMQEDTQETSSLGPIAQQYITRINEIFYDTELPLDQRREFIQQQQEYNGVSPDVQAIIDRHISYLFTNQVTCVVLPGIDEIFHDEQLTRDERRESIQKKQRYPFSPDVKAIIDGHISNLFTDELIYVILPELDLPSMKKDDVVAVTTRDQWAITSTDAQQKIYEMRSQLYRKQLVAKCRNLFDEERLVQPNDPNAKPNSVGIQDLLDAAEHWALTEEDYNGVLEAVSQFTPGGLATWKVFGNSLKRQQGVVDYAASKLASRRQGSSLEKASDSDLAPEPPQTFTSDPVQNTAPTSTANALFQSCKSMFSGWGRTAKDDPV